MSSSSLLSLFCETPKLIRLSKTLAVAAVAFFTFLVVFGNVTDFNTNFQFVHHVMTMDTIFPDATIKYRAISNPMLHKTFYIMIILAEAITCLFCTIGAYQLIKNIHGTAASFYQAKRYAILGLTLGFLTWYVGFNCIGGEWFGMWMSSSWNGIPDAGRFFMTILMILIFVAMDDKEFKRVQ